MYLQKNEFAFVLYLDTTICICKKRNNMYLPFHIKEITIISVLIKNHSSILRCREIMLMLVFGIYVKYMMENKPC